MMDKTVHHLYARLCRTLDTPRSLACFILAKHGEWAQLVNLRVDPSQFCTVHSTIDRFRKDTLATEFLRKCSGLPTGIDLVDAAVTAFESAEAQNLLTEIRLDRYLANVTLSSPLEWSFYQILDKAKSFLSKALGKIPDHLNGRFGPGSTFESSTWRHRRITALDKLRNTPTCTTAVLPYVDHLVWQTGLHFAYGSVVENRLLEVVRGNRFTTVPKDCTKDRGIAIEPGLNVWAQLAIGETLASRLRRIGIPKENGEEVHRRMAARASCSGSHATIDLSSASDTLSLSLVKLLLPNDWLTLLSDFRSPSTFVSRGKQKGWWYLRKFSSMGNGYTFELETLIFASLAHACGAKIGDDSFVYGDDIIVPTTISRQLLAVLRYSGFTPNIRKTFVDGYFRESCGGDYLNGQDVRSIYLKEFPHEPSDWIALANGLYDIAERWHMPELLPIRDAALDNVPSNIRQLRGPKVLGDLVITDEPRKWYYTTRRGIRYFKVWRPVTKKLCLKGRRYKYVDHLGVTRVYTHIREQGVALTAAILGLPSTGLAPRKGVTGYRFGRVAYS